MAGGSSLPSWQTLDILKSERKSTFTKRMLNYESFYFLDKDLSWVNHIDNFCSDSNLIHDAASKLTPVSKHKPYLGL